MYIHTYILIQTIVYIHTYIHTYTYIPGADPEIFKGGGGRAPVSGPGCHIQDLCTCLTLSRHNKIWLLRLLKASFCDPYKLILVLGLNEPFKQPKKDSLLLCFCSLSV